MIGSTIGALIGGGLSAGGSILGGLIGQGGANSAAAGIAAQNQQNQASIQHQQEVNTSEASPYTSLGLSATDMIGRILGFGKMYGEGGNGGRYRFDGSNAAADQTSALSSFQTSPGYQFRLQEGVNALDRSAAAKGRLLSGAQTKGVQNFGQGLASDEYNNWLGNYWKAAGAGETAALGTNALNSNLTGTGVGASSGAANAQGAAGMAGANALASGIGSGVNNALFAAGMFGGFGGGSSSYDLPGYARARGTSGYA